MSAVWRWFTGLSQTSRLALGGGLIAYGLVGSYLTDRAEETFGLVPTEEDKQKLRGLVPKISVVEHGGRSQDKDIDAQLEELNKSR
ncbi:hypothetical protein Dda_6521 [Drechslerella dactyloides]|uniref:Uncharacterized protein n=1 Tax=Drechslerella dactyloides TaxID=74499 RepID=A0AAD6ITQ7_DREDA|nr:hypothetical protein Dda_6521 [Drechslerella dactyloides]